MNISAEKEKSTPSAKQYVFCKQHLCNFLILLIASSNKYREMYIKRSMY